MPKSSTAPWAPPVALDRLAVVEASLPEDPAAALAAAADAAAAHVRLVQAEALQLYAGGNVPIAADHHPLLSNQPSMGYGGAKYQAGLDALDVVEVTVARLVAAVMGARFAEVRPTSATLANLAVYAATCAPGDAIAVLPGWAGGHLSHHAVGAAGIRGLRVAELPYDVDALDVDLDRLPAMLDAEAPRLVVVGASLMLRPHDLTAIAGIAHERGIPVLYDASHVSGLIAEGRFQRPLAEGADVVTFSTYKSFGGPAGGAIVADDADLMERVSTAVYPGLTANYDIARLLPLGAAAEAHRRADGAYADRCIALAQGLAGALAAEGLDVLGAPHAYTASHHVAVRTPEGGTAAALRLAQAAILLSEIGCPTAEQDPAGAIRIGTQTIATQGFSDTHMPSIATLVADVLLDRRDAAAVRADVLALRRSV